MDLSTTLSVVQTILTVIQTLNQMQSMSSTSDCKRELEDLQNTVKTVKAVLEDAAAKQDPLNSQEKHYIKELKDAVYDADDVLDEFLTLAKCKQLIQACDKVSDKVKSFFSRFKLLTHSISNKVKMVNKRLDDIAVKSSKFSFKVEYTPTKFTKVETSSFLCDKIIGRDEDVERIAHMLLGSDNVDQPDVSFVAIVGMGGLGKTALAQLVFNEARISEAFELKSWTCIADQDPEKWDLREFLGKVVKDLHVDNKHELTSLEQIHHEVREKLGGKKYLLVLDDVWTESYDKWQQFEGFLKVGQRGSRVVVTTRSKTTAQMIGGDQVHELRGLSEKESWHLFERMAFHVKERDDKLVKLGKEIVKKCTNVPLAIRVVGSLLRGQSKSMWLLFHENGLDSINESNDSITRLLKLSYDQLEPSLKICFAYCAIFPKDWKISKQMLIRLWMAQGYINLENSGEEYILILLQRCFFQDVLQDKYGEIEWFKMHDLFHDIAEQVAGEEISRLDFVTSNVGKGVRHLSLMNDYYTDGIFNKTHIRTYLQVNKEVYRMNSVESANQFLASKSILKWKCLRSLDLRKSHAESLPESIGQLLHLRCLDLSWSSKLRILPKSITKLVNLQTLDLHQCIRLLELPNDVSKLAGLSTLNVAGCISLIRMPSEIGMLTSLHTLCQFVVGVRGGSSPKQCFDGLKDLQHLNKLQGSLEIQIGVLKNAKFVKDEHGKGAYLGSKEYLKEIGIRFIRGSEYGRKEYEQALLEEMQPHRDVRKLELVGYHGETMPRWLGRGDNAASFDLPNLITLKLYSCGNLHWLPWEVAKLPHLKKLHLTDLKNLEYVVDVEPGTSGSREDLSFSSLVEIYFSGMPKLKGWYWTTGSGLHAVIPDTGGSNQERHLVWVSSPCFPQLTTLVISYCRKMTHVPVCPRLEHLVIHDCVRELRWTMMRSKSGHHSSLSWSYLKSWILRINNLEWAKSVLTKYNQSAAAIYIDSEVKLESLGEANELLPTCLLSSLRFLSFAHCPKLRSVVGWVEHVFALESWHIHDCPYLLQGGIPWQNLPGSLRFLSLTFSREIEELPEGMQYCTSLQSLKIWGCPKLECLPKWMPKLTSLRELQLRRCSKRLEERCQQPNGEDWPLIQHIPLTCIQTSSDEHKILPLARS